MIKKYIEERLEKSEPSTNLDLTFVKGQASHPLRNSEISDEEIEIMVEKLNKLTLPQALIE